MTSADRRAYAVRPLEQTPDPEAVARALAATGDAWCWLDGEAAAGRGDPRGTTYLGATREVRIAERGDEHEFLAELRADAPGAESSRDRDPRQQGADSDDPGFGHGWVTAFGYEFGVALLGVEPAKDDVASAFALRLEAVLAIDHLTGSAEVRGVDRAAIDAWCADYGAVLELADPEPEPRGRPPRGQTDPDVAWRTGPRDYEDAVDQCRDAIADGDAYVLCLTDTAEVRADADPISLYAALRSAGPAVRGGVIAAGDRALVSASPERFLSVSGGRVATHPIKGTRRRGETPEADALAAAELGAHPKERAENLMIVDLMRNDLSRICVPGTVGVEGFLRVEAHPHVHQLVSTVAGALLPGRDAYDALETAFPGGSMTGAPKRSAVEILARLEGAPRGLYSGCFGWIASDGSCELAMTIRGVELRDRRGGDGGVALVGAGGGITVDSDPAAELAEQRLKAGPLLDALRSR